MAATVVPRKPKAALSVRILAPCKSSLSQCYQPAWLQDPVKRTVCLKMAPSPYRLGFTVLHPEQQALVLKVLFDATDDGAFRFESVSVCIHICGRTNRCISEQGTLTSSMLAGGDREHHVQAMARGSRKKYFCAPWLDAVHYSKECQGVHQALVKGHSG